MDYSSPPTYHPGGIIGESAVPLLSSLLYSGFEGHMALVFYGDSSRIERVKTHLDNLANTKATLAIDEGGDLKGIFRTEYYGFYDSQVRKILTGKTPEERRRWLKGKLSGVGVGTKLISYRIENLDDLTKPVSVSVEFTLDNYVDLREREVPVILPPNVLSLEDLSSLASMKERKNPLVMKPRRRVSYEIVLSLPEDVEVKNYPIFSRSAPGFTCEISSKVNGNFAYSSSFRILSFEVNPDEYKEFKEAVRSFLLEKRRKVLLSKKNI